MVAHDLRTPLGAIGGYAALLLDELAAALSEDQRDSLAAIAALAERLNGLIENVLDLDQIEQGRLVLHKRACDLNQLVREIVQTLAPPLALRRLALELVLTEPAVTLEADPARLLQILHNLLSNAIKYSNDGGQIQVSTGREAAEAVVTVADTGLGMTEAQLANLFRLYYRTDNARLSKVAGTGLGLYIVRTLVELHGGRVAVASQPGQGTRVSVYLPAPGPDR
jgi:signal transduction histidine kinase